MLTFPKCKTISGCIYTGTWRKNVPVYTVFSENGLNQIVGYVKHINAGNGIVLYRGQCKLYESICPSILRESNTTSQDVDKLISTLDKMSNDLGMLNFFDLNTDDIAGWNLFKKLSFESALQHYGAKTYCVDFVDNHWTALWFGLYQFNSGTYKKRQYYKDFHENENDNICFSTISDTTKQIPPQPENIKIEDLTSEDLSYAEFLSNYSGKSREFHIKELIRRKNHSAQLIWLQKCNNIEKYNKEALRKQVDFGCDMKFAHMYLFLYVADTNQTVYKGVYLGTDSYTIDLRKCLPSTFLRPCAQHGWIVKGKDASFDFSKRVVCVIRINIPLVSNMLGNGTLTSVANFFPTPEHDYGYSMLLERQKGSGYYRHTKYQPILPEKMISLPFIE